MAFGAMIQTCLDTSPLKRGEGSPDGCVWRWRFAGLEFGESSWWDCRGSVGTIYYEKLFNYRRAVCLDLPTMCFSL